MKFCLVEFSVLSKPKFSNNLLFRFPIIEMTKNNTSSIDLYLYRWLFFLQCMDRTLARIDKTCFTDQVFTRSEFLDDKISWLTNSKNPLKSFNPDDCSRRNHESTCGRTVCDDLPLAVSQGQIGFKRPNSPKNRRQKSPGLGKGSRTQRKPGKKK